MSEEEKEAIRLLELCIDSNIPLPEEALSWVKIVLSYITKLKQENEHLKEQLLISNSLDNMYNLYISKDKIRDKIEEVVEDELNQKNDLDRIPRFYARKILESLLEEE